MSNEIDSTDVTLLLWCGLACAGWIGCAYCQRLIVASWPRRILYVPRLSLAFAFWFFSLETLNRFTEFASQWPFWLIAISAAIASEVVLASCRSEQAVATSRPKLSSVQTPLAVLRLALIGFLSGLLLEPVHTHEEEHEEEHAVAVLVDVSDSMSLPARLGVEPDQTRAQAANRFLMGDATDSNSLLKRMKRDYNVRLYEFGASVREVDQSRWQTLTELAGSREPDSSNWQASTDIADALRQVRGDIPAEKLSGVLLLTDGQDHSRTDLAHQCKPLGSRGIAVNSVVVGNKTPPKDSLIVGVQAPSQIYHGDSVSLTASMRVDQYNGETGTVRLFDGDELIEEKPFAVTSDSHRESVTFRHQPEEAKIHQYRVELAEFPGEETNQNNSVTKPVWVSQDRIRVLLIDERPRWEFRYLRNLFAGRDQTVFLQAVLLNADRLAGVPAPPTMRASAQRAFNDCEANALPLDESEWFKFDVIILGDVSAKQLAKEGIRTLERFVKDRGGSLVVVAGPNHMPHAYRNTPLADVLPVLINRPTGLRASSPDQSFHFSATSEGVSHAILQRAGGGDVASFPELTWRHPNSEAKPGASVLAYASRTLEHPDNAQTDLAEQRRQALMLWHRFGTGKVLQLNFDETWRLRYGIGDRLHHEFWGQIIRWAVSERLSAGTDLVRMGTDRTLYKSGERISVQARLLDANRNPITDAPVQVKVLLADEVIRTIDMAPHPDNVGTLQCEIRDLDQSGEYRIELSGGVVDELLALEGAGTRTVGLEIGVEGAAENIEMLDLVADDTIPRQIADWTDGTVVDVANAESVLSNFGPKSTFVRERWTVPLWNRWPVIGLFLCGLSLEWLLRKLTGRI